MAKEESEVEDEVLEEEEVTTEEVVSETETTEEYDIEEDVNASSVVKNSPKNLEQRPRSFSNCFLNSKVPKFKSSETQYGQALKSFVRN